VNAFSVEPIMSEKLQLNRPWLVAVWPGMGKVAFNAGIYMLAKLRMTAVAVLDAPLWFEIDSVEVKNGLIETPRQPPSRFFAWQNPDGPHDLLVFLGEAQPVVGKYPMCRQIIEFAKSWNVERVVTFAAMATNMRPEHPSRVFAAATDAKVLQELKRLEVEIMSDGQISGLNGLLLGAAAEAELPGLCLLGEMPHVFAQLPFPKASLAILEVFSSLARFHIDLTELSDRAAATERQLSELLARVEQELTDKPPREELAEDEHPPEATEAETESIDPAEYERIEQLFRSAATNRSKAFELKQELDRLGLFKKYEDRFLDLFRKPE
jgi:proteasome assembly chaperone (PAC2) family protein